MEKLKTKILLEVIDDIIIEYPDTNEFMQQKLNEKCDREGISIDKVIYFFLISLEAKHFKSSMLTSHSNCNLIYSKQKVFPSAFYNGSTYDFHLLIKELGKKFKGNFECLGYNKEKIKISICY